MRRNKNKIFKYIYFLGLVLMLSSCASYKSTWDCPKIRGIGCSSVEYADWIAREQILINKMQKQQSEQQDVLCTKDCGE